MGLKILNKKLKDPPNPRLGSCFIPGFWWIFTFIDGLWEVRTFFVEVADPQKYMNDDKWVLSWGGGLLVLNSYSIAALTTMNRLVPNLYQGFLLLFRGPKKILVRFGYQFEGVRIESLAKINGSRGSISARQGWSRRSREKWVMRSSKKSGGGM